MTYRIAAIDIHKNVLMVVVAIAAAEVADTAGEALEFICRQFGTGAQERQHLVSWLQAATTVPNRTACGRDFRWSPLCPSAIRRPSSGS
jgi:hypothetical protein